MTDIINFYEKMPKKLLKKAYNPNEHLHHFQLPFRGIISAPSGSGKTNVLLNLLHLFSQGDGTFADITIITRNKDEPLYNYLSEKSKGRIAITEGLNSIPKLDDMDKDENHLVCFDDLVLAKDQSKIVEYYIRARKLNCSVLYLSQSYFDIPPIIRKNCSYIIFMKIGGLRQVNTILRDFALGCSKEQLTGMYEYSTDEKMMPFIIDNETSNMQKKFRKGFNEYLDPNDFGDNN